MSDQLSDIVMLSYLILKEKLIQNTGSVHSAAGVTFAIDERGASSETVL